MSREDKFLVALLVVLAVAFVYVQNNNQRKKNQWYRDHPEAFRMYDAAERK